MINLKILVSLQPWIVGIVVFGGKYPATGYEGKGISFEAGVLWGQFLKAWVKLGAAQLTLKCLIDKKVFSQIVDADDEVNILMRKLQEENDLSTYLLSQSGYYGNILKAKAEFLKKEEECQRTSLPRKD